MSDDPIDHESDVETEFYPPDPEERRLTLEHKALADVAADLGCRGKNTTGLLGRLIGLRYAAAMENCSDDEVKASLVDVSRALDRAVGRNRGVSRKKLRKALASIVILAQEIKNPSVLLSL